MENKFNHFKGNILNHNKRKQTKAYTRIQSNHANYTTLTCAKRQASSNFLLIESFPSIVFVRESGILSIAWWEFQPSPEELSLISNGVPCPPRIFTFAALLGNCKAFTAARTVINRTTLTNTDIPTYPRNQSDRSKGERDLR